MRFGSLFTGVGGFDLGLEHAGFECAWQVEKDKFCLQILEEHYPNVRRYTDVREVGKHNLKPVDLICGGFPCQDLSVAGKRAGFDGERSSLWFEFERIIDEMRPKWVIIENVPGLLSSKQGRDFGFVLNALDDRGYGVAWRVLDSQYFGVPQRRRRVFIVGSLGSTSCAEVLFESESVSRNIEKGEKTRKDAPTATLRGFGHGWQGQHSDTNAVLAFDNYNQSVSDKQATLGQNCGMSTGRNLVGALQARDYKGIGNQYVNEGKVIVLNDQGGSQMSITENTTATLRSQEHGHQPIVWQMNHASEVYREAGDKVPTLQSRMGTGGNNVPLIGVRRLTPTECERLQGFPDGWTASQSDAQRYKQMGNAVTVNVIEWIGRRIKNTEDKIERRYVDEFAN